VKSKSERVLRLLERGPFLEEERERARKIAREIKGFGSFNLSSASRAVAQPPGDDGGRGYGRSNSRFEERWRREDGDEGDKENLVTRPEPPRVAREVEPEEPHHRHPFHGLGKQPPEAMLLLSQ
jgi:epsin